MFVAGVRVVEFGSKHVVESSSPAPYGLKPSLQQHGVKLFRLCLPDGNYESAEDVNCADSAVTWNTTGDIAVGNCITGRIIRNADFHNIAGGGGAGQRTATSNDDRRKRISSRPGLTNEPVSTRSAVLGGAVARRRRRLTTALY